jgi:putative ABC transport system ATP-binding protein
MGILKTQLRKTIIMVTHDPHAAERAERLLHLEKGRLVDDVAVAQPAAYPAMPAATTFRG